MPRISVIVPVYKVEQYLKRCVDSILEQTYIDFELILIDDGSPDNCPRMCDVYAKEDERVHVIHQSNRGLSVARNAGIDWSVENSNSKWITFIDSDDYVDTTYLECLYQAVLNHDVKIAVVDHVRTKGEELLLNVDMEKSYLISNREFYCQNSVNASVSWGKLYAKELFDNIRFPEGKIHEDEFVTYKLLYKTDKIAIVPYKLYAYFQNPKGIMNQIWGAKRLDKTDALREQLFFFEEKGYEEEKVKTAKTYVTNLINVVKRTRKLSMERENRKKYSKELRRVLKKYKNKLAMKPQEYMKEYVYSFLIVNDTAYWIKKKKSNFKYIFETKGIKGVIRKVILRV